MRSSRVIEELPAITAALRDITNYPEQDAWQAIPNTLPVNYPKVLWSKEPYAVDPCSITNIQSPFSQLGERARVEKATKEQDEELAPSRLLEVTHESVAALSIINEHRAKLIQVFHRWKVAREIGKLVPLALSDSKEALGIRRLSDKKESFETLSPLLSRNTRAMMRLQMATQNRPIKLSATR